LKIILSFGEAIAGRRKQKEMNMAKVRVFIFRFWPILPTLATIGEIWQWVGLLSRWGERPRVPSPLRFDAPRPARRWLRPTKLTHDPIFAQTLNGCWM
jgi:hypothetical protein